MARTLDDYLQRSKRANSKEVSEGAWAVFDQAYGIACQVIELREKHNLTQVELAEKTGVPQAQISRIERGVVSPTSATPGRSPKPSEPTCASSSVLSRALGRRVCSS